MLTRQQSVAEPASDEQTGSTTRDDEQVVPLQPATIANAKQAKRSRKELEQDDEPLEEVPAPKKPHISSQNEKSITASGKHIFRSMSCTANFGDVLTETYSSEESQDTNCPILDSQVEAHIHIYAYLREKFPIEVKQVPITGPGFIVRLLQQGVRDGQAKDIKYLKAYIAQIYGLQDMPKDKMLWGMHNAQTALLLRPMGVEVGSPEWEEILRGDIFPEPSSYPAFVYEGCNGPPNPENLQEGFLKDPALIKAARLIFFPPGHLNKETVSQKGYAAEFKIRHVTPAFIAYTVRLVRFCLSSEAAFGSGIFEYHTLYEELLEQLCSSALEKQTREILKYWDEQLFPSTAQQGQTNRKNKKTAGVVSSSLFIAQATRREKENVAPARLTELAEAAVADQGRDVA